MPLSWIQSFHSMFLNSVSKTDLFLSNNGMAASLKQKKNGIVILNQTTNGLKLESIQLLLAVVFSSASNQKPLFRYYSSVYKIFCPLWKNNYISDYCGRTQTLNTLICNHPQYSDIILRFIKYFVLYGKTITFQIIVEDLKLWIL